MPLPTPFFPQINIILDTKARREYPGSLTHAELKVPADKTMAWLRTATQGEFGSAVPIVGVRRLKDSGDISDDALVKDVLANNETIVAFAGEKAAAAAAGGGTSSSWAAA